MLSRYVCLLGRKSVLKPTSILKYSTSIRKDNKAIKSWPVQVRRDFSGTPKPNDSKSKLGLIASLGVSVSMLFGKTKYFLVALKLTKAAPLLSMVLTSLTYSLFFGLPYAVGMVGLIFVHECGHAVVLHRYGVPFSPMVFVPFMGAVIAMKEQPRNAHQEAMIAFGGPVAGSAAALGLAMLGTAQDSQLLYALADFGYMINLFNLIPIGSMDGGRVLSAVSPWFGVGGLGLGGWMIYAGAIHNPIFYLVMFTGAYQTVTRLMGWDDQPNRDYYKVSGKDQAKIVAGYVALIAALLAAMNENNKNRKTPKQLEHIQRYGYEDDWSAFKGKENAGGVYDDFFDKEH